MSYIIVDDNSKKITLDNFNDVSTKYVDPSDADITAEDVRDGKIAYGAEGKIIGTATIAGEGWYNTQDADITADDVKEGSIAYGANGKIIGTATVEPPVEFFKIENRTNEEGTIVLAKRGTVQDLKLKTSTDGVNWVDYYINATTTFTLPANGYVMFDGRENIGFTNSGSNNWGFTVNKQFNLSGDIATLINRDAYLQEDDFRYLFDDNINLISAENLNLSFKKVESTSYYGMFRGCKNMIAPPKLSAIVIWNSSYSNMFQSCTSLTSIEIPAIKTYTWGCYEMLTNCTSLNHVKCLITDGITSTNFINWMNRTAATGTFECAIGTKAAWEATGRIPSGWTIVEVSE